MKRISLFSVAAATLVWLTSVNAFSQDNLLITGWADDNHYLLQTYDELNSGILLSVDIRSGKSTSFKQSPSFRSRLARSLPGGYTPDMDVTIDDDQQSAVIGRDNDLFYYRDGFTELKRLTDDPSVEVNAKFSADGTKVAYTRNNDLYVYDIKADREIRLTNDASDVVYNGYASWVYMEEILGRASNFAAFWWSPDGNRIAYLRTDESEVPLFFLTRLDESDGVHGLLEITRYPKAGDPTPAVRMGIAEIATAKTIWVKTDPDVDQYIAWPFWTPDSRSLAIQVINRDQNNLNIILADAATGEYSSIYEEKHKTWVDFREDIEVLSNGSGFIMRSYRNGWENLYHVLWDGRIVQLTDFKFRVTSIDRIDEKNETIYFTATGTESADSHSFRIGFNGDDLFQMTNGAGTHTVSISPGGNYYIDTWSSVTSRGAIVAYDKRGRKIRDIHILSHPGENSQVTEMIRIKTSDNLFDMPVTITYPPRFDKTKKYPVIFTIYGGPDSRNVYNRWMGESSWYAMNGIVTIKVDHRGSGHFGKEGLDYMYRSLGKWEILDYQDAVKWLRNQSWVDAERIGITGSSYGGYLTCLALTKGSGYWTHGFASSAVTDWRLYDNIYTERFMDTPADNTEGYKQGSALNFVNDYKGKLYLTHGDIDDNVHMQNSVYLISKLQDEGKLFEFMLYPGERHGKAGMKGLHWRNEEYNFWLKNFYDKYE